MLFRDIHEIFGSEKAERYESKTEMGYLEELQEGSGEDAVRDEGGRLYKRGNGEGEGGGVMRKDKE